MRLVALLAAIAALAALVVATFAWAGQRAGDPRSGGLQVGLGEWAVALEAKAIRPGEVTFVIANRGRQAHGFRIRSVDDEGGHRHGGDRFEARTRVLRPGESARLTLRLVAGRYEIDCFVEEHDDLGMETTLQVRADAPLVRPRPAAGRRAVAIAGFKFAPATLRVPAGAAVRWTNEDAAPHTATSLTGGFASPQLKQGQSYVFRFRRAGRYRYVCALHPGMHGSILVTKRR